MKVIFLENIKNVAQMGDIKNVSDGYARNFLLPRKLAKQADERSQKEAELLKKKHAATAQARKERAEKLAKELEGFVLETSAEANEEGHLYGSITAEDISDLLQKNKLEVSEDEVNLPDHIKTVGEHDVALDLGSDVKVKIQLKVSAK